MSDCRSVSLQSSVGTTTAEELAEKYQKLFQDYSKIKAQHTVLKKAVLKEQAANSSLQEEVKTKEHEIRTSLQQLDLLTFHNQRLTKRIESLQDSGNARLAPGWLLGSAKKELERSKSTLEARSIELQSKIEENEKLHEELYEVKGVYTQRVNMLQTKLSELEKENEEYNIELTRSRLASEETLGILRDEKRRVEMELEQTRGDLKWAKARLEENEHKLKDGEDSLRAEMDALRDALSINLGLSDDAHSDKFNVLCDKIDSESKEMMASFKQLQSSARDYLKAHKENPHSSYSLGIQMKNASQVWHQNLQMLADKLASAQNRITELAAERENLAKENEKEVKAVAILEAEISRLKEELEKQRETKIANGSAPNDITEENGVDSDNDDGSLVEDREIASENEFSVQNFPNLQDIQNSQVNRESAKPENMSSYDDSSQTSKDDAFEMNLNQSLINHNTVPSSTNGGAQETEFVMVNNDIESPPTPQAPQPQTNTVTAYDESEDDDSSVFVYPESSSAEQIKELSTLQSAPSELNMRSHSPTSGGEDTIGGNGLSLSIGALERDTGRVEMSEGDCNREALIKKHYDFKIQQLIEQLQLADSKSVRFYKVVKVMQDKLNEADQEKQHYIKEISELRDENSRLKTEAEKQIHMMTDFMNTHFMNNQNTDQGQDGEDMGTTSK